jgi:hypothetical protein
VSLWQEYLYAQFRTDISLDKNWRSVADDNNKNRYNGFEKISFSDKNWRAVDVPHNWDAYEGYRRLRHGNRHGYAWYRRSFLIKQQGPGKKYFLFFEGVGSYSTVWLNGKQVGYHAGGRTTFTLDVSNAIKFNKENILAVRADHPAFIKDLPWVCGGCSDERGFSEGSQPMGIFRPVHLIVTDAVRIEPFGIHAWNDTTVTSASARISMEATIKNYSTEVRKITLVNKIADKNKNIVTKTSSEQIIQPGEKVIINPKPFVISDPKLWSTTEPYLYTIITEVIEKNKVIDEVRTPYGIRWIKWQITKKSSHQFLLNGKPVFMNGIAEYEHLIGSSHAFSDEQVKTRAMEIKSAGFNAFRDAHQPHNLRYQDYWDSLGILWWTQMSAHAWYDSPAFRKNFKELLKEWVIERRNDPSLVLWGLQNESKLPEDFAKECTELIRQLDPTASSQRLVTTCNGGSGTDWDVPQNWTGTYGGDPATYADDIKKQILVGEYGAWRTLDLHTENKNYTEPLMSEDRMAAMMETKVRLAESVKDSTAGHFMWLLTSHDNPGRVQGGEGLRELDRIGPVNYKGLLTPWEEPLDVYYMFRSNYVSALTDPMVYIVSHTWPQRWISSGVKNNITVYSNCDEVELFNDIGSVSLGRKKNGGVGTHFQWDGVNITDNILYAVGYVNGRPVAKDTVVLFGLPHSRGYNALLENPKDILQPEPGYNYIYRFNCGGPDYYDKFGNTWMADRSIDIYNQHKGSQLQTLFYGSTSWTNSFPGMPSFFASQRRISDIIKGTREWNLFRSFRYGREKLQFHFPVPDGEYRVELYFTEPWWGRGGGDHKGWRVFDVAINDITVLKDLDIWNEAGFASALKKIFAVTVKNGMIDISFPHIASGQAVISAIAIASIKNNIKAAPSPANIMQDLVVPELYSPWKVQQWLDVGDQQFTFHYADFRIIPPVLYGAEWLQTVPIMAKIPGPKKVTFRINRDADIYVSFNRTLPKPVWLKDFEDSKDSIENSKGTVYNVYKKRYRKNELVQLEQGQADLYNVFAVPVSQMEPAYDLKASVSYKAVSATLSGAVQSGMVEGKQRAIFNGKGEGAVTWNISTGVADIYSLTISYNNPKERNLKGMLQFFSSDGTLMKKEEVEFTPTRPGKSNYISTTTGTMINAGNYILRLSSKEAEGLSINSLDVQ